MAQGGDVPRLQQTFRDTRGRLMAGHPGLKRRGCVSWKRLWREALDEEIRLAGVPPAVRRLGLEGLWALILERAVLGGGPEELRALWALADELTRGERRRTRSVTT